VKGDLEILKIIDDAEALLKTRGKALSLDERRRIIYKLYRVTRCGTMPISSLPSNSPFTMRASAACRAALACSEARAL
jgi:hypothetical protein